MSMTLVKKYTSVTCVVVTLHRNSCTCFSYIVIKVVTFKVRIKFKDNQFHC